ncbi:MAG: ABC transporter ATP-binding protein [Candidatus Kaiserbacteria bacterium]|nr:ABC transporter ATP-binding protein [Candidatus Kaiserbacteria bacterium]
MKNTFATLWQVFHKYRWHVAALVVFGILSALLEGVGINAVVPLVSFFMGASSGPTDFITHTIQALFSFLHIPFSFRFLLGFILGLFILRAVSMVVFGYIRGWIGADFLGKESEDVLSQTLRASWPFLLKQKIGTMHNTLVRDIQNTDALLGVVAQIVQSFTGFLMYLLVAINISPMTTLYTLGGGGLLFFAVQPFLRRTRHLGGQAAEVEKQFAQFLSEHIIGMKSIKAAGAERIALADGIAHIHLLRALSIRLAFIRSSSASLFQPFSIVLVVILFVLTYTAPGFSIVSFAATLYLIQKIFTYLESGQNALLGMSQLLPYAQNVASFKEQLFAHREQIGKGKKSFVYNESLTFDHVSFSYVATQPVLTEISFSIARGETIGLIGPSGAGKTSIADIVLRLFRPSSGTLRLDGVPADDIGVEEWRQQMGYVAQDVFLFNGTLEENIRFYRAELSQEDIIAATKQANIYDFIMELPEGFQTMTGDRGVMLSGGQRQRIALARALASRPELLILDEATSALDAASEKLIQESIRALHGSITVLIIAHRLSTIENADRLLVLEHGKIVEEGAPHELLARPDSYFSKHHRGLRG